MKSWQVKGMEGGVTEGYAQTPFGKLPSFGIWADREETDDELLGIVQEGNREGKKVTTGQYSNRPMYDEWGSSAGSPDAGVEYDKAWGKGRTSERSITLLSGCRCGKVHGGDYALEDWGHHQCLHEEELTGVEIEVEGPELPEGACPELSRSKLRKISRKACSECNQRVCPEPSRRVQVVCPGCGQAWIAMIREG